MSFAQALPKLNLLNHPPSLSFKERGQGGELFVKRGREVNSHNNNHIPRLLPGFNIPVSLNNLFEWIMPVDNRFIISVFGPFAKPQHIRLADGRQRKQYFFTTQQRGNQCQEYI